MIVCPVCEHHQMQGAICDNCGKELVPRPPINVSRELMPGLETNSIASAAANVAVERMPELAEHRIGPVPVVAEPMPHLERTEFPDSGPAATAPLPDLEHTALPSDGRRTALPRFPTCRYCGHLQQSGSTICDNCGRALPMVRREEPKEVEVPRLACPSCGVVGEANKRCLACGAFIRIPSV